MAIGPQPVIANAFIQDEVNLRKAQLASLSDRAHQIALEGRAVIFGRPRIAWKSLRGARTGSRLVRSQIVEDLVSNHFGESESNAIRAIAGKICGSTRSKNRQRHPPNGDDRGDRRQHMRRDRTDHRGS
jgi:hypothetical protein